MGDTGLELPRDSGGKPGVSTPGGSKSGNKDAPFGDPAGVVTPTDSDLSRVAAAWPNLPAVIRAAMLALVSAGGGS